MVKPVAKAVGMALVNLAYGHINVETFVDFVLPCLGRKYDSDGQYVINFIKSNVLILHLIPNGIRTFHPCLDVIFYPHSVQRVAYRDRKSTRLNSSHANISYAVF